MTALTFTLSRDVDDIEFAILVEAEAALEFDRYELAALTPMEPPPDDQVRRRDYGYNLPFKHILSLGTHCYTASILQRQEWRQSSGPFDWIFSTPAMARHCLEDDFRTFLDRAHYEQVPIAQRPHPEHYRCHHRFYRDAYGVDYIFNHHDVWTDEGHDYLQRCVARFMHIVRGPDPVLLVQTRWAEADTDAQFAQTCALIDARFSACTFNAVAVRRTRSSGVCPELRVRRREDRHRLFELAPIGGWDATAFQDPLDELVLSRLIRLHRLNLAPPLS